MDINRTGSRKSHLEDPSQKTERTDARFKSPASPPVHPDTTAPPVGLAPAVTHADLKDTRKAEETLMRCFGKMVDDAGRQLGMPVSDSQRRDLLQFLGNDPVMRGKLLKYLEQIAK